MTVVVFLRVKHGLVLTVVKVRVCDRWNEGVLRLHVLFRTDILFSELLSII